MWEFIKNLFRKKPKQKVVKYNENQIILLRNKGYTQNEIADKTGLTQNQVKNILFRLIKEGKIQRKQLRRKHENKCDRRN